MGWWWGPLSTVSSRHVLRFCVFVRFARAVVRVEGGLSELMVILWRFVFRFERNNGLINGITLESFVWCIDSVMLKVLDHICIDIELTRPI